MSHLKSTFVFAAGALLVVGTATAATQSTFVTPITLSVAEPDAPGAALGSGANKSKLFRHRDGTLVTVYGDYVSAPAAGVDAENPFLIYDVKGQSERTPRDLFVRTCRPGALTDPLDPLSAVKTCNVETDWTAPVNISDSATKSSISTAWRGGATLRTAWGDAEKPNGFINPDGTTVVSWVSAYCPDGDPATAPVEAPVQRARLYIERDSRVIPFTCTWVAYSRDKGATWQPPVQLSSGERAAKQDVNRATQSGWVVTWQEDPTGLELGEAEGPGDGASGANVSGGTDIWYSYVPARPTDAPWAWQSAVRLTDNYDGGSGTPGGLDIVFDGAGVAVPDGDIEKGSAGASRANLGAVANTVVAAWEETKGSGGLDEGKFIRYLSFPFATPPQGSFDPGTGPVAIGTPGCIISDPAKNARRVRFVTQSATEAGTNGIQIGIFWKEGINTQGGPSDIRVRRGIYDGGVNTTSGLSVASFEPAVAASCATSDYAETTLLASDPAENLSSRSKEAANGVDNLADDTELQFSENALAHRGLLRGRDLWIGYSYTENLALLTFLNADNYNFWLRRYNADSGSWDRPKQISNITDTGVNLREPRLVGTQPSGPTCDPINAPTGPDCRNTDAFYIAWGTQTNVSPWAPEQPAELGLFVTRTMDAGATFDPVVQLSVAQGVFGGDIGEDEESERAFESQLQVRPDGNEIYAVWNQNVDEDTAHTVYTSGIPEEIAASTSSSGGCSYKPDGRADSSLWLLLSLALFGLGWQRRKGMAPHH